MGPAATDLWQSQPSLAETWKPLTLPPLSAAIKKGSEDSVLDILLPRRHFGALTARAARARVHVCACAFGRRGVAVLKLCARCPGAKPHLVRHSRCCERVTRSCPGFLSIFQG